MPGMTVSAWRMRAPGGIFASVPTAVIFPLRITMRPSLITPLLTVSICRARTTTTSSPNGSGRVCPCTGSRQAAVKRARIPGVENTFPPPPTAPSLPNFGGNPPVRTGDSPRIGGRGAIFKLAYTAEKTFLRGVVFAAAVVIHDPLRQERPRGDAPASLTVRVDDIAVDEHLLDGVARVEEAAALDNQVGVFAHLQAADAVSDPDGARRVDGQRPERQVLIHAHLDGDGSLDKQVVTGDDGAVRVEGDVLDPGARILHRNGVEAAVVGLVGEVVEARPDVAGDVALGRLLGGAQAAKLAMRDDDRQAPLVMEHAHGLHDVARPGGMDKDGGLMLDDVAHLLQPEDLFRLLGRLFFGVPRRIRGEQQLLGMGRRLTRLLIRLPGVVVLLRPIELLAQHPPHAHAAQAQVSGRPLRVVGLRDLDRAQFAQDQVLTLRPTQLP